MAQSSVDPKPALLQPLTAGVLSAVVGFASSFAVVLQGLAGVGATHAEAASGLLALCVIEGGIAIWLGLRHRMPIAIAWSTPGAAMLMGAGVPQGGFGVAVMAFLITGALIVIAGIWQPLRRAVAAIPMSLASAMLAGVLMELCLAPVQAVGAVPALALPVVVAWMLGWAFWRRYAVVFAVLVTVIVVIATTHIPPEAMALVKPELSFVTPVPDLIPALGIAIPLFLVTMASQNIPGLAVLRGNGYDAPVGEAFASTGVGSMIAAFFGGHGVNLSAITAALCAGPEGGPDPERRYIASVTGGVTYVVLGLCAGFAAALIAAAPPMIFQAVAGLALLSSLVASLKSALDSERHRVAAIVTFVTAASGISVAGIGAPFWGLCAGGLLLMLESWGLKLGRNG